MKDLRRLINPLDFNNIIKDLTEYVDDLKQTIKNKDKEIDRLNNFNRDEEIEKYKKEIARLHKNSLYIFSDRQMQKIKEFREEHYKKCECSYYDIIVSPTEIEDSVKIECFECGEQLDLNEYYKW